MGVESDPCSLDSATADMGVLPCSEALGSAAVLCCGCPKERPGEILPSTNVQASLRPVISASWEVGWLPRFKNTSQLIIMFNQRLRTLEQILG